MNAWKRWRWKAWLAALPMPATAATSVATAASGAASDAATSNPGIDPTLLLMFVVLIFLGAALGAVAGHAIARRRRLAARGVRG